MKLYLHIGLDKAGSSAIQAHVKLNAPWFLDRGVLIPESGLTGAYGHYGLFNDSTQDHFGALREELNEAASRGVEKAFISWEGLHFFSLEKLLEIKSQFSQYQVIVLLYLREQCEIIQSGYYQLVKRQRRNLGIEGVRGNKAFLCTDNRDYFLLLSKLEEVFGIDALRVRNFDTDLLMEQNIVIDFLEVLGLARDEKLVVAANLQNTSLDYSSVSLLNLLDGYFDDPVGR